MAADPTWLDLRRIGTRVDVHQVVVDINETSLQSAGNRHAWEVWADDEITGANILTAEIDTNDVAVYSQNGLGLRDLGTVTNTWSNTYTENVQAGTGQVLTISRSDGGTWATVSATGDVLLGVDTRWQDNVLLILGTSNDFIADWSTVQSNDGVVFAIGVGGGTQSGNFIITALGNRDVNHALVARAQPVLSIFSQTDPSVTPNQYAQIFHDTVNATFASGAGGIRIDPANGRVEIRRDLGGTSTELRINNNSAIAATFTAVRFFEGISERAHLEYDHNTPLLTLNTLTAVAIHLQTQSVTRISIESGGGVNMGTTTFANAQGEWSVGLSGTGNRMEYDPAGPLLRFRANNQAVFDLGVSSNHARLIMRRNDGSTGNDLNTGDGLVTAFNVAAVDLDFRVSASGVTDALFVDGANGNVTIAQRLRVGDGSAVLPAYSFSADTDTGIYRVGTDLLAVSCGTFVVARFSRRTTGGTAAVSLNQVVATAGSPSALVVTSGAHITLDATVEAITVDFDIDAIVQFATGALATQRAVVFRRPTYGFVAASVITTAATVSITGAPQEGTNATITEPCSFLVESGSVGLFDATPTFGGGVGVMFVGDAATVPTTNPTAGVILYSESGELKARLPGGDIIVLAEAP